VRDVDKALRFIVWSVILNETNLSVRLEPPQVHLTHTLAASRGVFNLVRDELLEISNMSTRNRSIHLFSVEKTIVWEFSSARIVLIFGFFFVCLSSLEASNLMTAFDSLVKSLKSTK
jgi:hypothetical protein